ncbi:MAG TPA: citrate lyase acyl carrier protein [Bacillota bacterium]|nr:citrate lyase acyl carrier protein [Bacillota bacterium]HPQ62457.1 citrate lyase acyl carrier protein [Bacillota bacterium]
MKTGIAGSLESNDVMITIKESEEQKIEIKSIVDAFFHDDIENTVKDVLRTKKLENVEVLVQDRGALDYTIRARLLTAIARMEKSDD